MTSERPRPNPFAIEPTTDEIDLLLADQTGDHPSPVAAAPPSAPPARDSSLPHWKERLAPAKPPELPPLAVEPTGSARAATPSRPPRAAPMLTKRIGFAASSLRKRGDDTIALVGATPRATESRISLLVQLASKRLGAERVRLLWTAASLADAHGRHEQSLALCETILAEDAAHSLAAMLKTRLLRKSGDASQADALALRRAQSTESERERGLLEASVAEPAEGTRAGAWRALVAAQSSPRAQRQASWGALSQTWQDHPARAALSRLALRDAIALHDVPSMASALSEAGLGDTLDEGLLALAAARNIAAGTAIAERAASMRTETVFASLREPLSWLAAVHAARAGADVVVGADAHPLEHRVLARRAYAQGDVQRAETHYAALAEGLSGRERADAFVRLAEMRTASGNVAGARHALRSAMMSNESHGALRLAESLQVRESAPVSRTADDALSVAGDAAALACEADDASIEAACLERLLELAPDPTVVDTVLTDAAAQARDAERLGISLRRGVDRLHGSARLGGLLVLADVATRQGHDAVIDPLLQEAVSTDATEVLASRVLSRRVWAHDAHAAAALWTAPFDDADEVSFAQAMSAAVLESEPAEAAEAWSAVLSAHPSDTGWMRAAAAFARRYGDLRLLSESVLALASAQVDAGASARFATRASYFLANVDLMASVAALQRAHSDTPEDAVLRELMLRVGDALSAHERANILLASADASSGPWAQALRVRAALTLELGGQTEDAVEIWQSVQDVQAMNAALLRLKSEETGFVEELCAATRAQLTHSTDEQRIGLLADLAELTSFHKRDDEAALALRHEILELFPGHVASLRALERDAFATARSTDAYAVEHSLAAAIEHGDDVVAHLRMAARLAARETSVTPDALDAFVVGAADRASLDLWTARQVESAALRQGWTAAAARASDAIARHVDGYDRGEYALRAAELWIELGEDERAFDVLLHALRAEAPHLMAARRLAVLAEDREDLATAVDAWELFARLCSDRDESFVAWMRAGVMAIDHLHDPLRAQRAFERACTIDLLRDDAFEQLTRVLRARDDRPALARWIAHRLGKQGDSAELSRYASELLVLSDEIDDPKIRQRALSAMVGADARDRHSLNQLIAAYRESQDWNRLADALLRLAKIETDAAVLKSTFVELGELYDSSLPDLRRAEAAFARAYKIDANDVAVVEKLASIYARQNRHEERSRALFHLAELATDAEQRNRYRLELAQAYEQSGATRQAEAMLEQLRKEAPYDLAPIMALADLHQRSGNSAGLAMHLQRAAGELRVHVLSALEDAPAWRALMDTLELRRRPDPARVVASAAVAIGQTDAAFTSRLDAAGQIPSAGPASILSDLDDLLAPDGFGSEIRAYLRQIEELTDRVLKLDTRLARAEQMLSKDHLWRPQMAEVARWFRAPDLELWVSPTPVGCVPLSSKPLAVLVGKDVFERATDRERLFLLVRACKLAQAGLAPLVRLPHAEVEAGLLGIMRMIDPNYAPIGRNVAELDEMARRIVKITGKKTRDEWVGQQRAMLSRTSLDATKLASLALQFGDRVGLLAVGTVGTGVSALLRLAADSAATLHGRARLDGILRVPQARALVEFALSEAHFDARRRVGADQR